MDCGGKDILYGPKGMHEGNQRGALEGKLVSALGRHPENAMTRKIISPNMEEDDNVNDSQLHSILVNSEDINFEEL